MSGSGFVMDVRVGTAHSRGRGYSTDVHPRVATHLVAAHPGVEVEEYRCRVLSNAVACRPEVVPAQVLARDWRPARHCMQAWIFGRAGVPCAHGAGAAADCERLSFRCAAPRLPRHGS